MHYPNVLTKPRKRVIFKIRLRAIRPSPIQKLPEMLVSLKIPPSLYNLPQEIFSSITSDLQGPSLIRDMNVTNRANVYEKHVLLTAAPTWSHFRTVCVLAAKFAAERPIVVTLLVPHYQNTFERSQQEVARCLSDVQSPVGIIRIIAMGQLVSDMSAIIQPNVQAFQDFWNKCLHSLPITCSATGKEFPGVTKPSLFFIDSVQYDLLTHVRATDTSPRITLLTWMMAFVGTMITIAFPSKYGGSSEITLPEFTPEEIANGRPSKSQGKIRRVHGLPDMYDWEDYPQEIFNIPMLNSQDNISYAFHMVARTIFESDGVATAGTVGYQGEELSNVVHEWAAENGKLSYHLGPILPLKAGTSEFAQSTLDAEMAAAPPGIGDKVRNFLDDMLKQRGENSVIYICFGTIFWPTNPDHLWLLLDTLSKRDIPFILSHSSPVTQVPEHVKERFSNIPESLLVSWAPQQTILSHKAIGWFVTHGGAGGTMDALTQGVPMIGWPFMADQPKNIAHLVHTMDVAFEFIEVRTGQNGLKPIYRTGKTPRGTLEAFGEELDEVLDNLTSEVGSRKRANAKKQQKILAAAWASGGPTRVSFDSLVQKFGL